MKIVWTSQAIQDRSDVWDHIAIDNLRAAAHMDKLFSAAADRLAAYPKLGRAGKIAGTRELLPHAHYRLVYEINGDTIWILALLHTARQWPPLRS